MKHQRAVRHLDLASADHLLAGKELGTGSMRPKVEAAADFVRAGGRRAIIAALAQGLPALRGAAGTTITPEHACTRTNTRLATSSSVTASRYRTATSRRRPPRRRPLRSVSVGRSW